MSRIEKAAASIKDGDTPLFSIIVPIYNVENYLLDCLESIAAQDFDDYEIICVNDGSTDDSHKMLLEFAEGCDRMTVVTQENAGLSAARNTGMEYAKGQYYLFVDSDDFIDTTTLTKASAHIAESNPDILIFGGYSVPSGSWDTFITTHDIEYVDDWITPAVLEPGVRTLMHGKVIRSATIKDNGLTFPLGLPIGEDHAFMFEFLPYAHKIKISSERIFFYRQRQNSMISNALGNPLKMIDMHFKLVGHILAQMHEANTIAGNEPLLQHWYIDFFYFDLIRTPDPFLYDALETFMQLFNTYLGQLCCDDQHKERYKTLVDLHENLKPEPSSFEGDKRPENPLFSIVVPVSFTDPHPEWAFMSLLNQSFTDFECIVVDFRPPQFAVNAPKDPRVKLITLSDANFAMACNAALAECRGQYVLFHDPNDHLKRIALETLSKRVSRIESDVVVFGANLYEETTKEAKEYPLACDYRFYPANEPVFSRNTIAGRLYNFTHMRSWNKLFSTKFLRGAGISFYESACFSDTMFTIRAITEANAITAIEQPLVYHHRNPDRFAYAAQDAGLIEFGVSLRSFTKSLDSYENGPELRRSLEYYSLANQWKILMRLGTNANTYDNFVRLYKSLKAEITNRYAMCDLAKVEEEVFLTPNSNRLLSLVLSEDEIHFAQAHQLYPFLEMSQDIKAKDECIAWQKSELHNWQEHASNLENIIKDKQNRIDQIEADKSYRACQKAKRVARKVVPRRH